VILESKNLEEMKQEEIDGLDSSSDEDENRFW